jgi:hypothetical protein
LRTRHDVIGWSLMGCPKVEKPGPIDFGFLSFHLSIYRIKSHLQFCFSFSSHLSARSRYRHLASNRENKKLAKICFDWNCNFYPQNRPKIYFSNKKLIQKCLYWSYFLCYLKNGHQTEYLGFRKKLKDYLINFAKKQIKVKICSAYPQLRFVIVFDARKCVQVFSSTNVLWNRFNENWCTCSFTLFWKSWFCDL